MSQIPPPELSRIIKLSEIGNVPLSGNLSANGEQLGALAKRFGIPSISSLDASYVIDATNRNIILSGKLSSELQQICAISGQKLLTKIDEDFHIAFVEKNEAPVNEEEIELDADDCDMIEYEGAQIDIGEAIAQSLCLALDPYPRGPEADKIAKKTGLISEEEAGPFGALATLKDKLA